MTTSRNRFRGTIVTVVVALPLAAGAAASVRADTEPAEAPVAPYAERERPDDPPAPLVPRALPFARSAGARIGFGPYVSVQVNVDEQGMNIVGDAANEPSIAVDPTDPSRIVIGWRQFDSSTSNFRQAGRGYSVDGGQSWTSPGPLDPGVFRSDPVLGAGSTGLFFYHSLSMEPDFGNEVFTSLDGGQSWLAPVPAFGGDKNWMTVDTTGGATDGRVYGIWQRFFGCCGQNTLTRSIDGAQSFEPPVAVAKRPTFGTLDVGPDGALYAAGIDGTFTQDLQTFVVARVEADGLGSAGTEVELGGSLGFADGPNPAGLLGQVNVAVDPGSPTFGGMVYVVSSLVPRPDGPLRDPLDVHFSRSADAGATWSAPLRINDDAPHRDAWQWFAAHDVAPNRRIDVIWADTRESLAANRSQLFYAYSYDAGQSWAGNVPVSPEFDSWIGWPNQQKLGDYYTIVSDDTGAGVAWAATFNGEQDVYYLRVFPDCDANGVSDVTDVRTGAVADCNSNDIPDGCEPSLDCLAAGSVPDGAGVPGPPLLLGKGAGDAIVLTWRASCLAGDEEYAVYEGELAAFTTHVPRVCSTGGATSFELMPGAEGRYYLVVPQGTLREGGYGVDSHGAPRPASATACLPHAVAGCVLH